MIWVDHTTRPGRGTPPPIDLGVAGKRLIKLGVAMLAVGLLAIGARLYFDYATIEGELERAGKNYPLNAEYAKCWRDGAKLLRNGQPVSMALGTVHDAWEPRRKELLARNVTPLFGRIIPEGKDDKDTTREEKLRLAEAWEEFARGLER